MRKFNESNIYLDIENLYYSNDDIRSLINQYIKEVDTTIRVANAVKILSDDQFGALKNAIDEILSDSIPAKDINVRASAKLLNESSGFGSGLLRIFLKLCNSVSEQDTPEIEKNTAYVYFLTWKNINMDFFKPQFLKFKSLSDLNHLINFENEYIHTYIGITKDLVLNFGLVTSNKDVIKVGSVKLTNNIYNVINSHDIFSKHFNETFNNIDFELFKKYIKIINKVSTLDIYHTEKEDYQVIDDNLIFRYAGYGTWNKSSINKEDYDSLKELIKFELNKVSVNDNIRFSLDANNYWITLKVKVI